MAERAADIPVNLEKTEPIFRRNSTGSFGIQSRQTKIIPHYLLRSEGSCHDLCKYGCKRDLSDLETTAKKSFPRTYLATLNGSKDHHPADNFDMQKRKSFGTMKPPLDSTSRINNQVTRKDISTSSKKVVSPTNPSHSKPTKPWKIPAHCSTAHCATAHVTSRRRFSEIIIPKGLEDFELNPLGGSGKKIAETKMVNETGNTKVIKKKVPVPPTGTSSTKSSSVAGSSSTKSSSVAGSSSTKSSLVAGSSTKSLSMAGTSSTKSSSVAGPSSNKSSSVAGTASNKSSSVAGPSSNKSLSVAGTSNNKSLPKRVLKNQNGLTKSKTNRVSDQNVLEKTLYVIEPEAESQSTAMVQKDSSLCQSPSYKSKDSKYEMFRKGKEIDIQPKEISLKRREFRQGKVLAANQSEKNDATDVSLRKLEIDANGKLNEDENKSSELNLRHQDVEEKKDSQNSINNVIEETASKLGKTRRSRVMALVGAFESVISLQDTKLAQKSRR